MDLLFHLFSWICGQPADRCFVVGGKLLPLCQRCLGVYCGLLFGALAAPGAFRRVAVWPGRVGIILIIAAIADMIVMGFHLIDPGPTARLLSGYAFGAALMWLGLPVAKAWNLGCIQRSSTLRETLQFLGLTIASAGGLVLALRLSWPLLYYGLSGLAFLGLAEAVLAAIALIVGRLILGRKIRRIDMADHLIEP